MGITKDENRQMENCSFTPETDKRIIEGYIGGRAAMVKELSRLGFSRDAIVERAKVLGLTDNFVKQCRLAGVDIAVRTCLRCDETFASIGPYNRICQRCKRGS